MACSDSNLDSFTHLQEREGLLQAIIMLNVLLVKLAVINNNSRLGLGLFSRFPLAVHGDLVIDAKLLWFKIWQWN